MSESDLTNRKGYVQYLCDLDSLVSIRLVESFKMFPVFKASCLTGLNQSPL